jgi:hypothetical protein
MYASRYLFFSVVAQKPCVRHTRHHRLQGLTPKSRSPATAVDKCVEQCFNQPSCRATEYVGSPNVSKRFCQLFDGNSATPGVMLVVTDQKDTITVSELFDKCPDGDGSMNTDAQIAEPAPQNCTKTPNMFTVAIYSYCSRSRATPS